MKKVLLALCAVVAIMAACTPKEVLPSSVQFDKTALSLAVGDNYSLKALVNPADAANKELTWASSADAVATVDQTGKVVAVAEGKATITATCKAASSVKATCEVTVNKKAIHVTAVQLTESEPVTLKVGETLQVDAVITPKDATDQNVTWASDNTEVASVSANGLVTALKGGVAYITATVDGVTSDALMVTVTEPRPIMAKYKQIELREGQNAGGAGKVWLCYGRDEDFVDATAWEERDEVASATWTSQNESIATVDNGTVYAVSPGTTTITVDDGLGSSLVIPVTVTAKPVATDDYLPGIRLIAPDELYNSETGRGWYAEGNRFVGEGYVPGTNCFHIKDHQRSGKVYRIAQCVFAPVDVSAIQNPALYIRIYISDVSKIQMDGANSQIELASQSDSEDWEEICWTGGKVFKNWWPEIDQQQNADIMRKYELKNGWNTIVLPFEWAEVTGGNIRKKSVCRFRWYQNPAAEYDLTGKGVEIAVDQLRVVDWTEYVAMNDNTKAMWMESGTVNNFACYDWKDELDGHQGVFGCKDEWMIATYTNIWLRDQSGRWAGREYSIPANYTPDELKFVWQVWVDDPDYFNNVVTTVELCSGSGYPVGGQTVAPQNWDTRNFKWTHNEGDNDLVYKKGWNTFEENLEIAHNDSDPVDIHSLYTFRIVFTNQGGARPSRHSYYFDDARIVKK